MDTAIGAELIEEVRSWLSYKHPYIFYKFLYMCDKLLHNFLKPSYNFYIFNFSELCRLCN